MSATLAMSEMPIKNVCTNYVVQKILTSLEKPVFAILAISGKGIYVPRQLNLNAEAIALETVLESAFATLDI